MGVLYFLAYLFIGFFIIYWVAGKSSSEENSGWVIAYIIGSLFWPIIICTYLFDKIKK